MSQLSRTRFQSRAAAATATAAAAQGASQSRRGGEEEEEDDDRDRVAGSVAAGGLADKKMGRKMTS